MLMPIPLNTNILVNLRSLHKELCLKFESKETIDIELCICMIPNTDLCLPKTYKSLDITCMTYLNHLQSCFQFSIQEADKVYS
jgi:hypothetical protein